MFFKKLDGALPRGCFDHLIHVPTVSDSLVALSFVHHSLTFVKLGVLIAGHWDQREHAKNVSNLTIINYEPSVIRKVFNLNEDDYRAD